MQDSFHNTLLFNTNMFGQLKLIKDSVPNDQSIYKHKYVWLVKANQKLFPITLKASKNTNMFVQLKQIKDYSPNAQSIYKQKMFGQSIQMTDSFPDTRTIY